MGEVNLPCHHRWFTNISERIKLPGFNNEYRWFDKFGGVDPEELTNDELREQYYRNEAYKEWLRAFGVKPGAMKWQVIRVHDRAHADYTTYDWWQDYRDCAFRVFMNPLTRYNGRGHKQEYILCPDDCYLTHCYERHKKGLSYPNRKTFGFISPHPDLRKLRVIPVEACKHFRHETTAGKLPGGNEFIQAEETA